MTDTDSSEKFFEYKNEIYPSYLKSGNANAYVEPFAKMFCSGNGLDIGGFSDWVFPGARAVNILNDDEWDAYKLPGSGYDYIFSSHTLEHLHDYVGALEYWRDSIKDEGILFLHLPHPDMEYWLPQNNRKHLHIFRPEDIAKTLRDLGFKNVIQSERDLGWSFTVVGQK
ncbi:methyltransferase domain-containing protein [Dehalococcoides mccartyi]|nr:methyltransferase domain-containing protein [Dehalococcoides mccartyi]